MEHLPLGEASEWRAGVCSPRADHRGGPRGWPLERAVKAGCRRLARALGQLLRGNAGALVVEAVIVYVPVTACFFCTWELAELAAADLVLRRAAAATSREAVVTFPDDPRHYGGAGVDELTARQRLARVQAVTLRTLRAAPQLAEGSLALRFELAPLDGTHERQLTTRLEADFVCRTGSIARIVCGLSGRIRLRARAIDVYHGARYQYARRDASDPPPSVTADRGAPNARPRGHRPTTASGRREPC